MFYSDKLNKQQVNTSTIINTVELVFLSEWEVCISLSKDSSCYRDELQAAFDSSFFSPTLN